MQKVYSIPLRAPIPMLILLFGLSMPLAAFAVQSLQIGNGFVSSNPDCTANPTCADPSTISDTLPSWIHTVSVSAGFTQAGDGLCRAQAGFNDVSAGASYRLMEVFASVYTPNTSSITLPTPIRLDPGDEVFVDATVSGDGVGDGECRVEAYFGARVTPAEEE